MTASISSPSYSRRRARNVRANGSARRPPSRARSTTRMTSGTGVRSWLTTSAMSTRPAGVRCSVLLDGLDLELEAGLLAHENAAALEGGIPGEAEVLTVDLGAGREAGPTAAPGVGRPTVVLDVEGDGLGHAVDGEVTHEAETARRVPLHPGAPERDLGVPLDVEEVGRAQVLVPLRVAGLDAGRVDLDLYPRAQGVVRDVDVARDASELSSYLAHH